MTPEPDHRFRTPSRGRFSFLAFGDSGLGSPEQQTLALLMAKEQPDLVLHVGDIAYESGTFSEFQANYFAYYASLMRRTPFFAVAGNHEYYTGMAAPYLALHAPPGDTVPPADYGRYYSFDWGDVHFVALDTTLLEYHPHAERMLEWLENDLRNSTARWRVAYFHHPPYPATHHADDPVCLLVRAHFVPVLDRYRVQLALTGHEHNYQRSLPMRGGRPVASGRATTYITTAGGGGVPHPSALTEFLAMNAAAYHYLRIEADANEIVVRAIGIDGKELDRATLANPSNTTIVNGASFSPSLAPGSLISIFGRGLAAQATAATSYPLPAALSGTSVMWNGIALPLFYVSTGQINAQLPVDARGDVPLQITTASGTVDATIKVAEAAPAIFPFGVRHLNGTPVGAASPAAPGETVVVFATGLGAVDLPVAAGQPAPIVPLSNVADPVVVEVGDIRVRPLFAGLSPGFAAVYQVNVVLPQDLPSRMYPLRLAVGTTTSEQVMVPVQGR
jgi:uncharacterized protein (TIGR03437 family)